MQSDDTINIKKHILWYLPAIQGIPDIHAEHDKMHHGFIHPTTGRMLCPAVLLPEFTKDPSK